MKHPMMHSRRARYGGVTISLIVTLVAALVLLNVIFSTLANHFSWYIDMTQDKLYTISDLCEELLGDTVDEAQQQIEIIFCENYNQYEKGQIGHYIASTARELAQLFPDVITLDYFDCWTDPSRARELGVSASTQIVVRTSDGEQKRVITQKECFVFDPSDTTTPIGYDGERVFATTIASFLKGDRPSAYMTANHDEAVLYDSALAYTLRDAGYNVGVLDLYYQDIPEDCELLVLVGPNTDMIVADGVSERSEIEKLDRYMQSGGNMMVFLSADTPELPNLEAFLAEWDIKVGRGYDELSGIGYNAMVKDTSAALSSDGYTILAEYATQGAGADVTRPLRELKYVPRVVFRDATVLLHADTPVATSRTRSDVFLASDAAVAMSSGKQLALDTERMALMTLTKDSESGASLLVCASSDFAATEHLQSAVFGNADVLLSVFGDMGLDGALVGLRYKPFASTDIASITTAQMLRWSLALSLIPAALVSALAITVLVRRKYS